MKDIVFLRPRKGLLVLLAAGSGPLRRAVTPNTAKQQFSSLHVRLLSFLSLFLFFLLVFGPLRRQKRGAFRLMLSAQLRLLRCPFLPEPGCLPPILGLIFRAAPGMLLIRVNAPSPQRAHGAAVYMLIKPQITAKSSADRYSAPFSSIKKKQQTSPLRDACCFYGTEAAKAAVYSDTTAFVHTRTEPHGHTCPHEAQYTHVGLLTYAFRRILSAGAPLRPSLLPITGIQ